MISLQNIEIQSITLGTTNVTEISFGDIPVWPSDFYYTLTYKQTDYSSSDKLYANGQNYATFTCYYRKYRSSNNSLVSTEEVIATPSSSTFYVESNDRLYFDYDDYKGTSIPSDSSVAVTLTYRGETATGKCKFQGNSPSYSISPIVLDSSLVDASGGVINYTGGEVTTSWTSGYVNSTTPKATFSTYAGCANSQVNTVIGYITSYTSQITIQSLARNATSGQSYYTFTSDSYGGQTVSVTVYQKQNAPHTTSQYAFWDVRTNAPYGTTLTLPAAYTTGDDTFGTIVFCVKYTSYTYYDADPEVTSSGGNSISNTSYDITLYAVQGGGCITSVSRVGSENWTGSYSPNATQNMKETILVAIDNSSSYSQWSASQQVQQPHQ